jgi:LmbE family N-acetylglucosaminyl deacetylase
MKTTFQKIFKWLLFIFTIGLLITIIIVLVFPLHTTPPNLPNFPKLSNQDRILIIAPHEDDETIGTGGIIQKASNLGIPIKVIYMTNGDANEFAFMAYRHEPWLTPAINREMGRTRQTEATKVLDQLGVVKNNIVFLGYPDRSTLTIWQNYWQIDKPFYNLLTNTTSVPYENTIGYQKPYTAESIYNDLKNQIVDFKPTKIFVTGPTDIHPDHQAAYLFTKLVTMRNQSELSQTQLYTYLVHYGFWPEPQGKHLSDWINLPKKLLTQKNYWLSSELDNQQIQNKFNYITQYKTQTADNYFDLISYAKKNELFCTDFEKILSKDNSNNPTTDQIDYYQNNDGLKLLINHNSLINKEITYDFYIDGFSSISDFSIMPKLYLTLQNSNLVIYNQAEKINSSDIKIENNNNQTSILLPWSFLGNPEKIFVQSSKSISDISIYNSEWKIFSRI